MMKTYIKYFFTAIILLGFGATLSSCKDSEEEILTLGKSANSMEKPFFEIEFITDNSARLYVTFPFPVTAYRTNWNSPEDIILYYQPVRSYSQENLTELTQIGKTEYSCTLYGLCPDTEYEYWLGEFCYEYDDVLIYWEPTTTMGRFKTPK